MNASDDLLDLLVARSFPKHVLNRGVQWSYRNYCRLGCRFGGCAMLTFAPRPVALSRAFQLGCTSRVVSVHEGYQQQLPTFVGLLPSAPRRLIMCCSAKISASMAETIPSSTAARSRYRSPRTPVCLQKEFDGALGPISIKAACKCMQRVGYEDSETCAGLFQAGCEQFMSASLARRWEHFGPSCAYSKATTSSSALWSVSVPYNLPTLVSVCHSRAESGEGANTDSVRNLCKPKS